MRSDARAHDRPPNRWTADSRAALRWGAAIVLLVLPAGTATAQGTLPRSCTQVTWPTSGTVYRPSVIYTAPRSLIADSLLRILPTHSWSVAGTGLEVREAVRRLWEVDSVLVGQALAEIITDDREFSLFTAVIAAESYELLSGRADPILSVFTEAGEPPSRLSWMLGALRPQLDTLAQAQVFGYACNAAWILVRSQADPFLRARAADERPVFFIIEAEGILSDAKRLVTGPLKGDVQTLIRITERKE
jgi:hypothetical protein